MAGALIGTASPASTVPSDAPGSYLRADDYRVATLGYRLAVAGRSRCAGPGSQSGIAFHHLGEYSPDNRARLLRYYPLDLGPGILAVVAGSPAARAGLRAGDVLVSIDGEVFPSPVAIAGESDEDRRRSLMTASQRLVEQHLDQGPAHLEVVRDGVRREIAIEPEPGCPLRVRLANSSQLNAFADGEQVVITGRLLDFVKSDDELAIVLAHELAHNLLGHAEALQRAGVPTGFFRRFGRNARHIRRTEEEADRFAVGLLVAAGFDPAAGTGLWQRLGRRSGGIRLFPTHPSARARADQWREAMAASGIATGEARSADRDR